jgi:ABC-type Fe3+-hydroxamate transport system substrate-binding protein
MKTYLVLPCLLLALALGACGGSGGGSTDAGSADQSTVDEGAAEKATIEKTLERAAVSTDPSRCTVFSTLAYVEQTTGLSGGAAVKQCEKEAPAKSGSKVGVSGLEVDGSKATAEVTINGGQFDGQKLKVALIKDGADWKVDEFVKFVDLDRADVVKGIEENFSEIAALKPDFVACFTKKFEQLPRPRFEESLLSAKRTERLSIKFGAACS